MQDKPGSIAYLARRLPLLSETFVIREIAALRRLGADVKLFSVHGPDLAVLHPELPDAVSEVTTLLSPTDLHFTAAHAYFIFKFPGRYFGCLWRYVLAPRQTWREKLRCLCHFLVSPHAAWCMREKRAAHIHAHFASIATSVAMMASRLLDIPFSFTVHAYDIFLDNPLMPEKLSDAKFVVVCSRFSEVYLNEHYPDARSPRMELVRYGIDPALFAGHPPGPNVSCPFILAVGRLVETKGFHTLIRACGLLRERGVEFKCGIIGAGPEQACLESMIRELGLREKVFLLGERQPAEVIEFYPEADLFVMPSCVRKNDRDGIPNVLLEAMISGVPVISTRVSGIPELVRDEETGLLVEPDDPVALARAMARFLEDRKLAESLSRSAKELVAREFNIERSAMRLLELFRERTGSS
jgi:colanic acid/amylovoran biosynthesis glycosyltransferase